MNVINKIIRGIANAVYNEFGENYRIYTENIEQGLDAPCFSIVCISPGVKQFLGARYKGEYLFALHYFPKNSENARAECYNVIERLYSVLEYIEVDGDLMRGTNTSASITDGVVSFIVHYDMFFYRKNNAEKMESLKTYNKIKNGDL